MDDHWKQVSLWFERVMDLSAEERSALLTRDCDSVEVRAEVLALCAADSRCGRQFEPSEGYRQILGGGLAADDEAGRIVGAYCLDSVLGRGGMGTVWLAHRQDDAFEKKVAVKLIRRGFDTDEIVRRFHLERQVLANLEHPGIARLIDGGAAEDGRPYMVLEHVDGVPIDVWCEERNLSTRKRLELFREVCDAVQWAHNHLVVHRDLKPSNILVTSNGKPRLLDFGIAKLLDPEEPGITGTLTGSSGLMTPEYASPEQVSGLAVSTSSDVYSLCVVLYQLLTSRLPYRFATRTPAEIARTICEATPERPSAASTRGSRNELSGDLDTILLKALSKEPERRYTSVEQFSEDVRRHLEGLPVRARPDSVSYRLSRFVRRNRAVSAAVLLVIVVSIGAAIISATYAVRARRSEAAARERAESIRAFANELLFGVYGQIERLPGATAAREEVVNMVVVYLEDLAIDAEGDPRLLCELARGYSRLADVQGHPSRPSLRDGEAALESLAQARRVLAAALELTPDDVDVARQSVALHVQQADFVTGMGRGADGLAAASRALESARMLCERDDGEAARWQEVQALTSRGNAHRRLGRSDEAIDDYTNALDAIAALPRGATRSSKARRQDQILQNKIGDLLVQSGDLDGARARFEAALETADVLLIQSPRNVLALRDKGATLARMAQIHLRRNDLERACELFEGAAAMSRRCVEIDPLDLSSLYDLALARSGVAASLQRAGKLDLAREHLEQCLKTFRELRERDPDNRKSRLALAVETSRLGEVERDAGNSGRARELFGQAITLLEDLLATDPEYAEADLRLCLNHDFLGSLLLKDGELELALIEIGSFHEQAESFTSRYAQDLRFLQQQAMAEDRLGMVHQALGGSDALETAERIRHYEEAILWYRRCLDRDAGFVERGLSINMGDQVRSLIAAEIPVMEEAIRELKSRSAP